MPSSKKNNPFNKIHDFFHELNVKIQSLYTKRIWRILLNKYTLVTIFFLVLIGFVDRNNVIQLTKTLFRINQQQEQQIYYKNEIKITEEKLNLLRSNRDSLEKFAREQYFFLEDSEDVFILEEPK
jgi:cell division protein FtsB